MLTASLNTADPLVGGINRNCQYAVAFAILTHFAVWSLGSIIYIENLHYDTIELVYWGRDWMLGYGKHPPLATWIIDLAVRWGPIPIISLMILAQLCVAVSAYFIWKSARLYTPVATAAFAAIVFLASPAATYFSVQLNHNILLMPFWSATLYAGLRLFQKQDIRSGIIAGAVAGLSALVKYEVIVLLATLLILGTAIPAYRPAFKKAGIWIGFAVFCIILAPHFMWLAKHDWSILTYALDARKTDGPDVSLVGLHGILMAINNVLVGHGILAIGPLIIFALAAILGVRFKLDRTHFRSALILASGPPALLVIATLLTLQIPKQSWFIVFIPNIAVAMALVFVPAGKSGKSFRIEPWSYATALVSLLQFVLFLGFIIIRDQLGSPVYAFDLRARVLAEHVRDIWEDHHSGNLQCILINEDRIAGSAILWLKDRPNVVDLSSPYWAGPERIASCARTGGIAIMNPAEPMPSLPGLIPSICIQNPVQLKIPTRFGGLKNAKSVELYFIPPADAHDDCSEHG